MRRAGSETFVVPEIDWGTVRASCAIWGPIVKRYFRSQVAGMERIPTEQCLIVQHHDGGLFPVNGICFGVAWHQHFEFQRPLYVLAHDLIHHVFDRFTDLLPRSGLVPADREVVDAIAPGGHDILVFPGAARESFRPFWERDRIDLGGRTGFVRQALKHRLPILPVVSAGSHETLIVLARGASIAERLGLRRIVRSADSLPLLAGLPWGIWVLPFLPQLPLPAKVTSEVLEPIYLEGDPDDRAAVQAGFDTVLERMQTALTRLYAQRRWPIVG